jgi:hypothetical protein
MVWLVPSMRITIWVFAGWLAARIFTTLELVPVNPLVAFPLALKKVALQERLHRSFSRHMGNRGRHEPAPDMGVDDVVLDIIGC